MESDEEDIAFKEAMAILKAANKEYENEPEDFVPIVGMAIARSLDVLLVPPNLTRCFAKFLGVTP